MTAADMRSFEFHPSNSLSETNIELTPFLPCHREQQHDHPHKKRAPYDKKGITVTMEKMLIDWFKQTSNT
ncbi:hypothetical protein KIN20_010101 [Parelaphostrongylus tenuis]|uniref:Uncharacterized protein n=1 Tax=Parelaphostrongylus tenuis TaxID=148309 RepID=A0AAD5M945_PARTN|nr:hypothetical protein KIN20_010101 [Parelaphostrongylus tenuis]